MTPWTEPQMIMFRWSVGAVCFMFIVSVLAALIAHAWWQITTVMKWRQPRNLPKWVGSLWLIALTFWAWGVFLIFYPTAGKLP